MPHPPNLPMSAGGLDQGLSTYPKSLKNQRRPIAKNRLGGGGVIFAV